MLRPHGHLFMRITLSVYARDSGDFLRPSFHASLVYDQSALNILRRKFILVTVRYCSKRSSLGAFIFHARIFQYFTLQVFRLSHCTSTFSVPSSCTIIPSHLSRYYMSSWLYGSCTSILTFFSYYFQFIWFVAANSLTRISSTWPSRVEVTKRPQSLTHLSRQVYVSGTGGGGRFKTFRNVIMRPYSIVGYYFYYYWEWKALLAGLSYYFLLVCVPFSRRRRGLESYKGHCTWPRVRRSSEWLRPVEVNES